MVLQVLAGEFLRTGVEESSLGAVFRELSARLRTEAMSVLSLPGVQFNYIAYKALCFEYGWLLKPCKMCSGTVAACARLSAMRLLLAEHFRFFWPKFSPFFTLDESH